MRISYSGMETFSQCPAKYKFQYIDRIRVLKSKEAVFGTLIHECLKYFHEPSQLTPPQEEQLLKYFTEKWNPDVYQDKQEEAFAFHQGVDILKKYYSQNQNKQFNIVNLETPFGAPVLEDKDFHQITGRIDRIDKLEDGTFEVIDYKTTKKMPAQTDVDNNFQLSIYYLGIANRWPSIKEQNRPVKLSLYYLRHGEKLSAFKNNQEIKETEKKILDLINQINSSKFEPKTIPLCDWCQYQPHCPLYRHKFIKEQSPAPDDRKIKQVLKEYFEIKEKQSTETKRLGELKEMINQYCDSKGIDRVFGDDGYITRLPQQRFSYNLDKVRQVLEPIGKWDYILTIDKTKFKKIVDSLSYDLRKQINEAKTLDREFKMLKIWKKPTINSKNVF